MDRITGATVEPDLHGAGKDGFREGAPGSPPATSVTELWLNSVQEEICTVIENGGSVLNGGNNDQLYDGVIKAAGLRYIGGAIASHVSRTSPVSMDYRGIAYGASDALFVAVGTTAQGPCTSPDGVTWTNRSVADYRAVCEHSGRFVCVGASGSIATTDNGSAYTARTADAAYASTFYSCHHGSGSSYYVIAGVAGEVQTSADAVTWTHQTGGPGTSTFFGGAYGSGVHVLVGGDSPNLNMIYTASNASIGTWTARTPSTANGVIGAVAYGNGAFITVGYDGSGDPLIMRSVDLGVTWEDIDIPNDIAVPFFSIAYDPDNQVFVAVGDDGKIIVSRDGSNGSWRDVSRASFTTSINALAFGDGTCVMVGPGSAIRQSLAFPWME
jgi:hypothetical protein